MNRLLVEIIHYERLWFFQCYQQVLQETLQRLLTLISVSRERQRELEEEVTILTKPLVRKKKDVDQQPKDQNPAWKWLKKAHISFFGTPYFKDANFECPPKNEDAKTAEDLNFKDIALSCSYRPCNFFFAFQLFFLFFCVIILLFYLLVTMIERRKLVEAVRDEARELKGREMVKQRDELINAASITSYSSDESESIKKRIESISRGIYNLDRITDAELLHNRDLAIDWNKIAVRTVQV